MLTATQDLLASDGPAISFASLVGTPTTNVDFFGSILGIRSPAIYKAATGAISGIVRIALPVTGRPRRGRILQSIGLELSCENFGVDVTGLSGRTYGAITVTDGTTTKTLLAQQTIASPNMGAVNEHRAEPRVDAGALDPELDWTLDIPIASNMTTGSVLGTALLVARLLTDWTYIRPQA